MRNDPCGRRLPVQPDITSDGEFAPAALRPAARREPYPAVEAHARGLGLSRRRYPVSALGAAATPAALDRAFAAASARGGRYAPSKQAPFEPAAAHAARVSGFSRAARHVALIAMYTSPIRDARAPRRKTRAVGPR